MNNDAENIIRLHGLTIDLCAKRTDDEAIQTYARWMNDEDFIHYLSRNTKTATVRDEREWAERKNEENEHVFNIVTKEGHLIGNCDICTYHNGVCGSLGICIGEKGAWGKGYGTEAIKMLIKYGFEELRVENISLWVVATNARALSCYLKAGMKKCGTLHKSLFIGGEYVDMHQLEILREDCYGSE